MAKKLGAAAAAGPQAAESRAAFSKALPYYKWFPKDYRASRKVQGLTYVERGLLRELLDECWDEGFIPDEIDRLAEICGCPAGVMERSWRRLRHFFVPLDDLDGALLTNRRLDKERTEQDRKRANLAAAGKRGGIRKAALANASKSHNGSGKSHIAGAGAGESLQDSPETAEHGGGATTPAALEGARTSPAAPPSTTTASVAQTARALIESGAKPRRLTIADTREVAVA